MSTTHPSSSRLRSLASTGFWLLLLGALIFMLVGWIASTEGSSNTSAAMVRWGGLTAALTLLPLFFLRPGLGPGWRPLFALALGLWPFLAFGAFLYWQIHLSAEQSEACLEAADAEACETLARKRQRRGNYEDALRYHAAACALDAPRACTSLAAMHRRGLAGTPDPDAALQALEHACETLAFSPACAPLADLLLDPHSSAHDPERARSLLTSRCNEGDAEACERLRLHHAAPASETTP